MGWFHKHDWVLVGRTYFPGRPLSSIHGIMGDEFRALVYATSEKTTFLWKCSDKNCDAIRKEECLGKEMRNDV